MTGKKVIGIDYGTLSARAVVVSCDDGRVIAQHMYEYPHGVITSSLEDGTAVPDGFALAHPVDYRTALIECVKSAMEKSGASKDDICGIGIDATTYTLVPCLYDGTVISEISGYENNPHAYIKLWKHKGAKPQADKIQKLYDEKGFFPVLKRYGGVSNCEWALPKLLELYENAPEIVGRADRFCDLGEWLAIMLTGKDRCGMYTAGYRLMWAPDLGWPDREQLEELAPGFSGMYEEKVMREVSLYDKPWGYLTEEMAEILGLNEGIPVATPMGDGSMPGVYFCINEPKAIAITVGTSTAMAFTADELKAIPGINGVVYGGIVPGEWSYDAGQPCAGDMLSWMCDNLISRKVTDEAAEQGMDIHSYLSKKSEEKAWKNSLTVLDWWNGNRSILNDMTLKGSILGMTMSTAPDEIYCAFIQSLACSMRRILEHFEQNGIVFDKIILCGGIPLKNPFFTSQLATFLKRTVYVSTQKQTTAVSACMLAAMACGISTQEVCKAMTAKEYLEIEPETEHTDEYEEIYSRWCFYHDLLSRNKWKA